ncbi:MAG: hypothetical protein AAF311_03945 [Pseudomonadota bacterium]
MTKIMVSALFLSVCAAASPAAACGFHGLNGMHWTPSSQWQDFSPRKSYIDPAFSDAEMGNVAPPSTIPPSTMPSKRARPTFANAADKAARAAMAMQLMKSGGNASPVSARAPSDRMAAGKDRSAETSGLETDAQPIGQTTP